MKIWTGANTQGSMLLSSLEFQVSAIVRFIGIVCKLNYKLLEMNYLRFKGLNIELSSYNLTKISLFVTCPRLFVWLCSS